jgi:hypothetical protein
MLTGMLAVENALDNQNHNLWIVNAEEEYHEEIYGDASADEVVEAMQEALTHVFTRLSPVPFGAAVGLAFGLLIFAATFLLVLRGGDLIGPNLQLLGQFFPGYTVTLAGSLLGLAYGFLGGFLLGWGYAFLRNFAMFCHVAFVQRKAELGVLREFLDYL